MTLRFIELVEEIDKKLSTWPEPQKSQMLQMVQEVLRMVDSLIKMEAIIKDLRKKENAWELEERDRIQWDKGFREGHKKGFEEGKEEG